MVVDPRSTPHVQALLESIGRGPPLAPDARSAFRGLLGVDVGLEGLSQLFQPGFPGVRTFAVEVRTAPDQAVEFTVVGIARDGAPVWSGKRTFAHGRSGALEIHRGFDEIEPAYQSRNITVDLMRRELDLLGLLDGGPSTRLTIDADGVGRYICALHGFVFADETEEGPPVRSRRSLEPAGDRERLVLAARHVVERAAERNELGADSVEGALAGFRSARTPWDFARVQLPGAQPEFAEGDDGEMGVGALGREFLLADETPAWRAALYFEAKDKQLRRVSSEYRRRKTARSEARLAAEIQEAREALASGNRSARLRALERLGAIAPPWVAPEIKALLDGADRRLAAVARATLRQVNGSDLPEHMLAFATNEANAPRLRGLAYRVLAEHFPRRIEDRVPMLRVNPDARIQRAAIPIVRESASDLAILLAANPWNEGGDARAGLSDLRLELIEKLAVLAEPSTLPALMESFRARPAPPPSEMLALSRALVAFADPRAQLVLKEVARRLERPAFP